MNKDEGSELRVGLVHSAWEGGELSDLDWFKNFETRWFCVGPKVWRRGVCREVSRHMAVELIRHTWEFRRWIRVPEFGTDADLFRDA